MATITYGKGKTLRPTPLAALRDTIEQNARHGKVEMLDIPAKRAGKVIEEAGNRLQSDHADVRAAKNVLAQTRTGSGSSERSKGAGEKNVRMASLKRTRRCVSVYMRRT